MQVDPRSRVLTVVTLVTVVALALTGAHGNRARAADRSTAQVAQSATPARRVIQPPRFPKTGLPYSPGILVGDTLYLSGQLGRDPATAKLVTGGITAETRQALSNLREVLRAAGLDFQDVVSVTAFIVDFAEFPKFNETYREVFATDPPARATVQVAGLNLGARVEIQMIAVRAGSR
jgi:2-iminobutanoate/2-iminopropanoate deaminase